MYVWTSLSEDRRRRGAAAARQHRRNSLLVLRTSNSLEILIFICWLVTEEEKSCSQIPTLHFLLWSELKRKQPKTRTTRPSGVLWDSGVRSHLLDSSRPPGSACWRCETAPPRSGSRRPGTDICSSQHKRVGLRLTLDSVPAAATLASVTLCTDSTADVCCCRA